MRTIIPTATFALALTVALPLTLAFAPPASAVLLEVDLVPGSGDRDLTRDTTTGLDWLDLELTLNLSVDDVDAGIGGWTAQGFRVATISEVFTLHMGLGVFETPLDDDQAQIEAFAPTRALGALIGCTSPAFCVASDFDGFQNIDARAKGDTANPAVPGGVWSASILQDIPGMRSTVAYSDRARGDLRIGSRGIYVVREVAEPAAVWMILAGAGGISASRHLALVPGLCSTHPRRRGLEADSRPLLCAERPARAERAGRPLRGSRADIGGCPSARWAPRQRRESLPGTGILGGWPASVRATAADVRSCRLLGV